MPHLRQLQRPHDGSEAKHVAHGALELGGDLDDLVQQRGPLLGRAGAAQHVHGQHGGHGLEPGGRTPWFQRLALVTTQAANPGNINSCLNKLLREPVRGEAKSKI